MSPFCDWPSLTIELHSIIKGTCFDSVMGEHFLLGIGLDLCLAIFTKLYPLVNGLRATESVDNDSENAASVELLLFEPQFKSIFALCMGRLTIHLLTAGIRLAS